MVMEKNSKDALTAAEIKEIKKHLEELKADAEKRLKDKKNMELLIDDLTAPFFMRLIIN